MGYPEIRRIAVLVLGTAWGLTAIPTTSAQSSNTADACGLLSRAAVEQAFGASVGEGAVRVNNGVATSCSFPVKGGGSISILLRRNVGRAWIAEQERRMDDGVRYGGFRPVAGLGEQAFIFDMGDAGAALCVFRPDYYLQVSVFQAGSAATVFAGVEKLAKAALNGHEMARSQSVPATSTCGSQR